MAILYPPLDTINNFRPKPTEGELAILNCLNNNLDDTYEIFFQPYINGDMPDIIIMKQGHGLYILEVKDWHLKKYELNEVQDWYYQGNRIKSPFHQVHKYKQNLYGLHIDGLAERNILNSQHWRFVKCGVYFHCETTTKVELFIKPGCSQESIDGKNRYNRYVQFLSYFDVIGMDRVNDSLASYIDNHLPFKNPDNLFDSEIYQSIRRYLKPPRHTEEMGRQIIYSAEQQKIIESKPESQQKVKGVAGSGKTLCLAKRAVNAHLRHGESVLILTFNITLRNYIHDKINEIREKFDWSAFRIIHFHKFFASLLVNSNIEESMDTILSNPSLWKDIDCPKYDTILIDEIQDYMPDWINFIRSRLLNEGGELVVYGDEKQNIYERKMEEKERRPYTGIAGQWNLLKRSYRVSNSIARLSELYQKSFFSSKYDIDEILIQRDLFENSHLDFFNLDSYSEEQIWSMIEEELKEYEVHPNDVCIQATKIEPIRRLEAYVNEQYSIKTMSMFEHQTVYEKLCRTDTNGKKTSPEPRSLEELRKNKKFHFWNNPGTMKFCTVHSYKGWEIDTLVLLVGSKVSDSDEPSHEEYISDELIYTAITRCRNNLIVIEIGGNRYENFFRQNLTLVT